MKTYNFDVKLQPDEDGRWSAWLASYPACCAWGYSKSEALEALKNMTEVFVGVMKDSGESVYADSVEDHDFSGQKGIAVVGDAIWDSASVQNDVLSVPVHA